MPAYSALSQVLTLRDESDAVEAMSKKPLQRINSSNRRMRTRLSGGVGGEER